MARYQEKFTLTPEDIEIIERALRLQKSNNVVRDGEFSFDPDRHQQLRAVDAVLGKIHNQKIFYAQVNAPGIPAG